MNIIDILFARHLSKEEPPGPFPPVIKRKTGNPIEITDAAAAPIVKCEVQIQGYQEGIGTPSPQNVRNIVAYNSGTVEIRGEGNIWDEEWENGSYTNGQKTTDASKIRCKNPIPCKPSTTYFFAAPSNGNIQFLKDDGTYISNAGVLGDTTFTTPSTARYIVFNMYNAYGSTYGDNISINYPSTITTYKAYNGKKHTATFSQSIYSGSADYVGGSAECDMPVIDLGDLTWTKVATQGSHWRFQASLTGGKGGSSTVATNLICSHYVSITGNQSYTGIIGVSLIGNPSVIIYVCDENYSDAASFTTAMSGVKLAYELATPTTETITPSNLPIMSLSGYNHIESSTGDMTLDYITDAYQNFVDTTERAIPNTRKSGPKAMDIFTTLDNPSSPDDKAVDEEKATVEKSEEKR